MTDTARNEEAFTTTRQSWSRTTRVRRPVHQRGRGRNIVLAAVGALSTVGLSACGSTPVASTSTPTSSDPSATPPPQTSATSSLPRPTVPAQSNNGPHVVNIGESALTDGAQVTVNRVKFASCPNPLVYEPPGSTILLIDVTIKNISNTDGIDDDPVTWDVSSSVPELPSTFLPSAQLQNVCTNDNYQNGPQINTPGVSENIEYSFLIPGSLHHIKIEWNQSAYTPAPTVAFLVGQ